MATQIVILNGDSIKIDDSFHINWADKGNAIPALPSTLHALIWNNLTGQNEIQSKDASTGSMTGNTDLSSTDDAVGSTTVAALLTWGSTRKDEIVQAQADEAAAKTTAENTWLESNSDLMEFVWDKTWIDYDPNYS